MYQTWAFGHNKLSDLNRDYTGTNNRLNLVASLVGPVGR